MNRLVSSDLPTIYADLNVYRYIAHNDITIEKPERFRWVYSHVHLNEMNRSGNTDALKGMQILKAVEIDDVLNEKFESVGNIVLRNYVDPEVRYKQHLETIAGYEGYDDIFVEPLLHLFGADNFKELSLTPEKLRDQIDSLTSELDDERRSKLLQQAKEVSVEMKEIIDIHLQKRHPIDKTRNNLGLKSSVRKEAEKSESPIDKLWEIIAPAVGEVEKDQFFGFEPSPEIQGIQHTQHGAITSAHTILNLLGFSPDKKLSRREKIKNIMSDGQHAGMASYCNGLLSADTNFCKKANAIFKHIDSFTNTLWFQYSKGYVVRLEIVKPEKDTD